MSNDTDVSTVADSIQESVGNAVGSDEVSSMLEAESADAAGRELGQRIGREVGSRLGQELGFIVARDIRERKGPRTILRNAYRRLVEVCKELYRSIDLKSNIPKVIEVGRGVVSDSSATDVVESVLPGDESGNGAESDTTGEEAESEAEEAVDDAGAEEVAEEAGEAAEEAEETESDEEGLSAADLSADEMRELKEETYKELLESMSYRDLQSLAKDVGVKANLAQDEMTDRIVAEFSEEGES